MARLRRSLKALDNGDITDEQQERMCELCEELIIGGSSCTQLYVCEGQHCSVAIDYIKDELIEAHRDRVWYWRLWNWWRAKWVHWRSSQTDPITLPDDLLKQSQKLAEEMRKLKEDDPEFYEQLKSNPW